MTATGLPAMRVLREDWLDGRHSNPYRARAWNRDRTANMNRPDREGRGRAPAWRVFEKDGWEILVGRGAADNDALTFREASPRDLWLHAAGYAGSHVVIRVPEGADPPPADVTAYAARLAAFHSKARNARGKIDVHVCRVADVRKPRGAPAGQVEIRNFSKVRVYPAP